MYEIIEWYEFVFRPFAEIVDTIALDPLAFGFGFVNIALIYVLYAILIYRAGGR